MVTALEHLTEWSVRQTTNGVELWDHGGIWALAVGSRHPAIQELRRQAVGDAERFARKRGK